MPVTLLQIVDDAKFKEFLKMPGSWRVQKKIKLIFAEILEDITGNKAETSNTSDLHKVVTLFISKKNTHALIHTISYPYIPIITHNISCYSSICCYKFAIFG